MKLSVIVTNYNKSEWLPPLLETLKNQKNDEVEYIIIDDASTDNSKEILDNLDRDIFKVICHTENIGIGLTRQEGLDVSVGDYIAYIDGDDNIANNYIITLLKYVTQDYDVVQFPYQICPGGEIISDREFNYIWCKIFSRTFILRHNIKFKDIGIGEDYFFNADVDSKIPKYKRLQEPVLYFYNTLSISLTRSE